MNLTCLRIWHYLAQHQHAADKSPSLEEIGGACFASLFTVRYHLLKLEQIGALRRTPGRNRSIEVLQAPPDAVCPDCGRDLRVFAQCLDFPQVLSADCLNPTCQMHYVTLPLGDHWLLTADERAGYRRARDRAQRREMAVTA